MSFASINGVALHYRLSGAQDGMPLILVNSLGTSLDIWDETLPHLARRFRILCYDKRGHGLSDIPAGPYSLNDHAGDLMGLADHCGFARFALCGISIGGMIAIRIAARFPGKVLSLVLCDTAATIGTQEMWNDRIARVEQEGMGAIAEAVLTRWVSPGYRERRPADFAGWRNMLERCPADGYAASCATVRDTDLHAELRTISAPTIVLAGEHDVSTPPEAARGLAVAIPGARFALVRGAGHVPAIEQPERLGTLIGEHLNEVAHV